MNADASIAGQIFSAVRVLGIVAIGQTGVIISGGFDPSVAGVLPIAWGDTLKLYDNSADPNTAISVAKPTPG